MTRVLDERTPASVELLLLDKPATAGLVAAEFVDRADIVYYTEYYHNLVFAVVDRARN